MFTGKTDYLPGTHSLDVDTPYGQSDRSNHSSFNYQRLTTTLQEYTKICTRLRANDVVQYVEGIMLRVIITHIENEKFFWAQIVEDSVNGLNRNLEHLKALSIDIQNEPKIECISGLGRCLAMYQNEWFRAWCTFRTERNGVEMGDVLFIDYGNRSFAQKSQMIKSKPTVWSLPPMAQPFKLIDYKGDLDRLLNEIITLEVVEPGSHRTNSLTTVRLLV